MAGGIGMKQMQTEIIRRANGAVTRKERINPWRVVRYRTAIAVRFAAEGANIAINYRSGAEQAEATRAMAKAARSNGSGRELVVQADVSNEDQVKQMFATTIEEFGQLDILVNNAGIQKPCPSHEIESSDFDRVISVNLRGPFLCSREAIRHFLSRPGGGVILNNSSVHEIYRSQNT
jgi:glucose 1-dehydrogenase